MIGQVMVQLWCSLMLLGFVGLLNVVLVGWLVYRLVRAVRAARRRWWCCRVCQRWQPGGTRRRHKKVCLPELVDRFLAEVFGPGGQDLAGSSGRGAR